MAVHSRLFLLLLLACPALFQSDPPTSNRLKDRIYTTLASQGFCFVRTNGTHRFGCTSGVNGNVGVLRLVSSDDDVDWIAEDRGGHAPYVAAFNRPDVFRRGALEKLGRSGHVSGVLLLDRRQQQQPSHQSDDAPCPNDASSLYGDGDARQCATRRDDEAWNPNGESLLFGKWDFPMFLVRDNDTIAQIESCHDEYNLPADAADWPLCALEMKSHMYAAVDTRTCMRRSRLGNSLSPVLHCDPLGDLNTFMFLRDRNASQIDGEEEKERSVIMVSTQLDALNLFDQNEFGAAVPAVPIVTLLQLAKLLADAENDGQLEFQDGVSNIMFSLFFGEAFDYIGSSRFVYDMNEQTFPAEMDEDKYSDGQQPLLEPKHLRLNLELGQLFNRAGRNSLYLHTDKVGQESERQRRLINLARQNNVNVATADSIAEKGLPPSSLHSLLKADRDLPGILLSDFDGAYTNAYYHSLYDDASNVLYDYAKGEDQDVVKRIADLSTSLAQFLFREASGEQASMPAFQANATLINEMLRCYIERGDCAMFLAASSSSLPPFYGQASEDTPYSQYVGVERQYQKHGLFTFNLLAWLTGRVVEDVEKSADCVAPKKQNVYAYHFLKGEGTPAHWTGDTPCNETADCGYCVRTSAFFQRAVSPAFVIEDYDLTNATYSSWAESVWPKETGLRMFLKASPGQQLSHLLLGVAVLVVSGVLAVFVERNAKEIFAEVDSTSTNDAGVASTISAPGAADTANGATARASL